MITVNRKRIGKLLHQLRLSAKRSRYRHKYCNRRCSLVIRPHLIHLYFQTKAKNEIWLGDVTYISTIAGTLYLSIFIDIYSRKIVGWAVGSRMQDKLVTEIFNQDYHREKPKE